MTENTQNKNRVCYVMVRDVPAPEGDAGLEWGVDYGLEEGEELPKDIEDLTEAQYSVYMMIRALKGTFDEVSIEEMRGEKGSGLIVPT